MFIVLDFADDDEIDSNLNMYQSYIELFQTKVCKVDFDGVQANESNGLIFWLYEHASY